MMFKPFMTMPIILFVLTVIMSPLHAMPSASAPSNLVAANAQDDEPEAAATQEEEKVPAQETEKEESAEKADAAMPSAATTTQAPDSEAEEMPNAAASEPEEEKQEKPAPVDKKKKKKEEEKDIYLNFENTDLSNFINYMAEVRKLNLIPDKTLEGAKVSLTIRDPLTPQGAWNIFLTVLEMAGFSIVQVGDVHKVIPKDQKLTQPLPSYINVPADTLPDSDITIRYVFFLQNLNVESSVKDLLESMLSDKHTLISQKEVNGFIITDKSFNIKSAVKLVQELDDTGQAEAVVVMRLKSANATDVRDLLKSLMKQQDTSPLARLLGKQAEGTTDYFPPGTRIIPEERTNSLILMGASGPIKKIEDFIINHIDTELKATESPLHIYELQYTDAMQIAEILKEVTQSPEGGPGQQAARFGAIRGGVKYFKSMNFQVDKDGNRLIVSSTDKEDWELLKKTIADLDKPQPQITVETLLVSISQKDLKDMGGAIRNKKHGQLGGQVDFQSAAISGSPSLEGGDDAPTSLLGSMLQQLISRQGAMLLSFGKANNIWGVFEAIKQKTNASIISQPFITVANKTKASIEVGDEVRVLQEDGGTSGVKGFVPVNASTKIEFEPQINLDGIIRMSINVDISEFLDASTGHKEEKKLTTNVTVADGQVLVLGGFVKTKVTETKIKTPVLGDIPIIGWLFKRQTREIEKTYIFIFMSPTIVKPRQIPGVGLYTKMKLHQVTDDIEHGIKTTKTRDPIFNWFFNAEKENYSHKVIDYANARYQPTTVDIQNDPYYRTQTHKSEKEEMEEKAGSPSPQEETPTSQETSQEEHATKPMQPSQKNEASIAKSSSIIENATKEHDDSRRSEASSLTTSSPSNPVLPKPVEGPRRPQQAILQSVKQKATETGRDRSIDEQRKKLKDLLSQSLFNQQSAPAEEQSHPLAEKKEQLKKFIEPGIKQQQLKEFIQEEQPAPRPPQQKTPVDPLKRRSLKDFLSRNTKIAPKDAA